MVVRASKRSFVNRRVRPCYHLARAARLLRYAWAFFPGTMLGLLAAGLGLVSGGRFALRRGILEVHGGAVHHVLQCGIPGIGAMPAMTLGHVVLGRDAQTLDHWRAHERVHVRQYELWGPLFLPALVCFALKQLITGNDPYYDNYFERQAYNSAASPRQVAWRPRRNRLKSPIAALVRTSEL